MKNPSLPPFSKGRDRKPSAILLPASFPDRVIPMTEEQKTAEQLVNEAADLGRQEKYAEAIALCDEALIIAPKDHLAFLLRGVNKFSLGHKKDAIEDISQAIENGKKDNDKSLCFHARGLLLFESGRFDEAENDYREAAKYDPFNKTAYYAKFILSAAKGLFPDSKNIDAFSNLVVSLHKLLDTVLVIKGKHLLKEEDGSCVEVTHFTKYETLKSMLPDKQPEGYEENCLRLYNVIYMNDPLEGRRLIEHDKKIGMNVLKDIFHSDDSHHKIHSSGKEFGVYISSLTLFSDKLYLWRAYGNDGNGYCIVTPIKEFRQEISSPMLDLGKENKPKERGLAALMELLNLSKFDNKVPPTLYRVLIPPRFCRHPVKLHWRSVRNRRGFCTPGSNATVFDYRTLPYIRISPVLPPFSVPSPGGTPIPF